jgi:hypothetical protein
MLLDRGRLDSDEVARRMGLVLTPGVPPGRAAAWVEGFLAGGGTLLVHDDRLLALVDRWLMAVPPDTFIEVLPLLRRTFSEYATAERRAIGERIRQYGAGSKSRRDDEPELDRARADRVRPVLAALLGRDVLDDHDADREVVRT